MEQNKKYTDIFNAGERLFYKYGLKKVTIEDICKEANVSKMTFYKFFPNKIELVKVILNMLFDKWYGRYKSALNSDLSFAEKMKQFVEIKLEASKDRSKDFIMDLYYNPVEEMKEFMADYIRRGIDESLAIFSFAQEKGWMRRDLKPELLYILTEKIAEVTLDEKVLSLYEGNITEMVREITKFYLYGISDEL